MTTIQAYYRHHGNHVPFYIKHSDVEQVAAHIRSQLVPAQREALTIEDLSSITALEVNSVEYDVWLDMDHELLDDDQNPVYGVFEYEPSSAINAVSVCVAPKSEELIDEVRLSTLAHEMGHAVFDAPAMIVHHQNDPTAHMDEGSRLRAYRLTTENQDHLQQASVMLPDDVRFAEFRANEFMGSLLVPRDLLWNAIEEMAKEYSLELDYGQGMPGQQKIIWNYFDFNIDRKTLAEKLAPRFGVTPIFIEVRMKRYGMSD
jgi:hypothetical protein